MPRPVISCLLLVLSACGGDDSTSKGSSDSASASAAQGLSARALKELAERTLDGWQARDARATNKNAQVTFTREALTAKGLKLNVVVRIGICPGDLALCYSIDPEDPGNKTWARQARNAMAKQGAKDAIASAEPVELQDGRQALGLYRAGYARSPAGKGTGTTLGMDVRYRDDRNAIHMKISASGEKQASNSDELSAYLSKTEASAAAREVFAVFADKF